LLKAYYFSKKFTSTRLLAAGTLANQMWQVSHVSGGNKEGLIERKFLKVTFFF
jgi:hypothetical protein